MHSPDEILDHFLCDFDVGDDTVAQWANGLDAVGRLAHHQLGFVAYGLDPLDPVDRFDRHDGRFIKNDALILNIDQCIGSTEIDSHVLGTEFEKIAQKTHREPNFRIAYRGIDPGYIIRRARCDWECGSLTTRRRKRQGIRVKTGAKNAVRLV